MTQAGDSRRACSKIFRSLFSVALPLLIAFSPNAAFKSEISSSIQGRSGAQKLSAGIFLVADPQMLDPNFSRTVILLLQHDQGGSLGLIINRKTTIPLSQLLPDAASQLDPNEHLFRGGPVSRETLTFLFRSKNPPRTAKPIFEDVYGSREARVLVSQLQEAPEATYHLYAGYAAWEPGQLEAEIEREDWHLASPDARLLFEAPSHQIWERVFERTQQQFVKDGRTLRPEFAI